LSQSLEQKFQWKRVLGFGKVIHMMIVEENVTKTLCGHDVSSYTTKEQAMGKKCGLCENIRKQYESSLVQKERFNIDYMPSEAFNSSRYK
jgi:hypothetical protein